MAEYLADLTVNGIGQASGGRFRLVRIDGVGTINGDIECEGYRVNGVARVQGHVKADLVEVHGKLDGQGDFAVGSLLVEGQMNVRGRVSGERIDLAGQIKLSGDCEAERFAGQGGFDIDGLLNADHVEITLHWRSKAREIGGEYIDIRRGQEKSWGRLLQWAVPVFRPSLKASLIEGDYIRLEETEAPLVCGNRIEIGPGCRIGRVEYRTELTIHPDAEVGERIQTGV